MEIFTSVPEFFNSRKEGIFTFLVYKRSYTPYEQQKAFMDESGLEGPYYGFVRQCISLGNGDYLVGFQQVEDPVECDPVAFDWIDYYKLSEIQLSFNFKTKGDG